MIFSRSQTPLRAITRSAVSGNANGVICLYEAFAQLGIQSTRANGKGVGGALGAVRHSTHKAQGAVNKAKDGPGKRLGAKKSGEQYVIPGNIIFRQRGTHWFPGDNCAMGRDHTIYATEHGYVKYYKDPNRNPKKQYIGLVFERNQVLPLPQGAMRRRKLNMVAQKMPSIITPETHVLADSEDLVVEDEGVERDALGLMAVKAVVKKAEVADDGKPKLRLRPGGMYRESNWEIGRAAERANVKVRKFKPRDRWVAWRKQEKRGKAIQDKRNMGRKKGMKK